LAQQSIEIEKVKEENEILINKALELEHSYETLQSIIQKIALNIESICILRGEQEYIPNICNRIIRAFRAKGADRLDSTIYRALSTKGFSRFKNEHSSSRTIQDERDLPEEISVEMNQIKEAVYTLRKVEWSRYQDDFVKQTQSSMAEAVDKVEIYQDTHNIIRYNREYNVLEDNDRNSEYSLKRPLIEPPRDESYNVIRMQYEYLIMDIKSFVNDFVKRYYPSDEEMPYYARGIYAFRKFFNQYESNKIHRDFKSWSEIYAADEGIHPSGKSAKEVSARYGAKVRRYDKSTGEEIYGRKGICKEQIQKKKPSLVSFMQQVYHTVPLFMFIHKQYASGKERIFVDYAIDIKEKRQHYA
jgi:hypothetical protein